MTCNGTPEVCGAALQTALNAPGPDAAVYVCTGVYRGGFTITTAVTVIGAGQGDNAAVDTILNGNDAAKVIAIPGNNHTIDLRQLRITAGRTNDINGGAGIDHVGMRLVVTDCTVSDNHTNASSGSVVRGAISMGALSQLEMTGCTIRDNSVTNGAVNGRAWGAGIYGSGQLAMTDCVIRNNTAPDCAGSISGSGCGTAPRPRERHGKLPRSGLTASQRNPQTPYDPASRSGTFPRVLA